MFLIWIAGGAVSFVAIFFYGYGKVKYISNDGNSESPTSACQIRMPDVTGNSNQTRPTEYEGIFSCDFYDGMIPFSPFFSILATLVILFFSCNSCALGQKISLIASRREGAYYNDINNENYHNTLIQGDNVINNNNNIQAPNYSNYNNVEYLLHVGNDDDGDNDEDGSRIIISWFFFNVQELGIL